MTPKIAIIGSGPTGIYTLKGLALARTPTDITVFEAEGDPGKGTPYHPDINDPAMLANIASIEFPPICEPLVAWLVRQDDDTLARLRVRRDAIDEREFYPRVVLGEYMKAQFEQLCRIAVENGHSITVRPHNRVLDIALQPDDIRLTVEEAGGSEHLDFAFEHVVMATGHNWPENTEIKPGYFVSPWPAAALKGIHNCPVAILGTSLSGIDALMTVATAHGTFYLDAAGQLQYQPAPDTEDFHATMMSRKGLLPEADFYCEVPYLPPVYCTEDAIDASIATGATGLLDRVFALFKEELSHADPDYAARIGLSQLTVETLAPAYFADRAEVDPFAWAGRNLMEAEQNKTQKYTVPWRYSILRMHEIIARAVPHLNEDDLKRFHRYFKTVFVDNYATVPHASIQRLLALHRANKLEIAALGDEYDIRTDGVKTGVVISHHGEDHAYGAFIDATGQSSLSARDLPFPTLVAQGGVRESATAKAVTWLDVEADVEIVRTGGIDLDDRFRPLQTGNLSNRLYCAAISFLLHKLPFVQGITSARDIGEVVAAAIIEDVDAAEAPMLQASA